MANGPKHKLWKLMGSWGGSQISYSICVDNGQILYNTENEGHAFMRHGDASSTKEISLDALRNNSVRDGGNYYEATRIEVERQLRLMKETDSETESRTPETTTAENVSLLNSRSPRRIPDDILNLACLKDLSMHDQGLFLITCIASLFPRGKTFAKASLFESKGDRGDPNRLARSFPEHERESALKYLQVDPWNVIERAEYVVEEPRRSGRYMVTHVGQVVFNRTVFGPDDRYEDDLPF